MKPAWAQCALWESGERDTEKGTQVEGCSQGAGKKLLGKDASSVLDMGLHDLFTDASRIEVSFGTATAGPAVLRSLFWLADAVCTCSQAEREKIKSLRVRSSCAFPLTSGKCAPRALLCGAWHRSVEPLTSELAS